MITALIAYNIGTANPRVDEFFVRLKQLGESWHKADELDTVWFVRTGLPVDGMADHLRQVLTAEDSLFVVDITGQARQGWMSDDLWTWLNAGGAVAG